MKNAKHIIAIFYVTLILLLKVAGLHALTHDTDDTTEVDNCEVCIVETALNLTPLIEAETPALPATTYYFSEQEFTNKVSYVDFKNTYLESYHSTRPPPQFS